MTIRIVQGEDTGRTCLQASVVSTGADPPVPTNIDSKTAETYELSQDLPTNIKINRQHNK